MSLDLLTLSPADETGVACAFLGTSTVILRDNTDGSAVLTDGFVSRPGLSNVALGRVRPDARMIDEVLGRLRLERAGAVVVTHSHYDHALDAPLVAQRLDADLVGSPSTWEIANGYEFARSRFCAAELGVAAPYGAFTVEVRLSKHSPGDRFPGIITSPVTPPARAREFCTGETYSVVFGHPRGTVVVHGSANYRPGCLAGVRADVIFLGIGALGRQSDEFRLRYWDETVVAVGARRVIPVHWDRFWRPITRELRPLPWPFDDVGASMAFLRERAAADGVELASAPTLSWCDPFAPLV